MTVHGSLWRKVTCRPSFRKSDNLRWEQRIELVGYHDLVQRYIQHVKLQTVDTTTKVTYTFTEPMLFSYFKREIKKLSRIQFFSNFVIYFLYRKH